MSPDIIFRAAEMCDLRELHALVEGAYRGDSARGGWTHEADLVEGPRTTRDTLATAVGSSEDVLLLALRDGAMFGCVHLTRLAPGVTYLGMLTVDPRAQAAGLGKRILAFAEAEAVRRFGATIMQLSVVSLRAELLAYYQRRGYALTGEARPFPVELDPPLTLLVMEKHLANGPTVPR